jgi:hypothetical protein
VANTLLTISLITNEALPVLAHECILTDKFNRQYDKEFGRKGEKIGGTCNVRVPPRYLGTFGPALNVESSVENYFPVSILYQYHVDMQFSTINFALDIDEFSERFITPACRAVANRIDSDGAFFAMQNTGNRVGTPGISPTQFKAFSDARAYLVSEGMPRNMIPTAVLHPFANSSMADSLKGLYNPQAQIADVYENGLVAKKTAGADWFEDANIANYTTGSLLGTPVLAGATSVAGGTALLASGFAQTGTFEISGLTGSSAACKVGDTLQVKGVYPVNPQNRSQYGTTLKQFVVLPPGGYTQVQGAASPGGPAFAAATLANGTFTASSGLYTATSGGLLTVTVGDCLIYGGQFQNCTAPVSTYTVTCNGGAALSTTSTENLYFHRDAFALAMVDLPLPRSAVEASRAYDDDLGISIRIVSQYTVNNDAEPTRLDVAYGFGSLYRGLATRVSG